MTRNDLEYFLERAITERELAKAARNPNAVAAHEELAMRYDALIKKLARPFRRAVITSRVAQAAQAWKRAEIRR